MNIGDCINHPIPNSRNILQWLGIGWSLPSMSLFKNPFRNQIVGSCHHKFIEL